MRARFTSRVTAVALVATASAVGTATETAPSGPVVVELFTSQGCNSCPPADALLGELAQRSGVLALAFHVTYWDELGWRDRFGLAASDRRQYAYAQVLGRASVYTPQMVVNGTRDVLGSSRAAIERALRSAERSAQIGLARNSRSLVADLPALPVSCDCTLWQLEVLDAARTPVGRGENGGRTLAEWQIVESIVAVGRWDGRSANRTLATVRMATDNQRSTVLLAQDTRSQRVVAAGRIR